jgi:choloylglycine hydrolase
MRNVSVPWGQADPDHPNLAPTYWRTVIDQSNRIYYFESALSPNIVWVDLKALDLSPGSGIRRVRVEGNDALMGSINANLEPSEPIAYLAP